MGCCVLGFGFWVLGFGFWVLGFGLWVVGFGFRVLGFGFVCERGPLAYRKHPNRTTLHLLYTSLCTGELNAIRKHKCFLCSPFYVKGVSLGYVGRIKT